MADKRNGQSLAKLIGAPAQRANGAGGRVKAWIDQERRKQPVDHAKIAVVEKLSRQIGDI